MSSPPRLRTGPTEEGFRLLLQALDPEPEAAGERFRALHKKLSTYFEYARCSDPEHWADETLDRLAKRLIEGVAVDDLNAFLYGVARLVSLEARRLDQRSREAYAQPIAVPERVSEASLRCLDGCMKALQPAQSSLIERYYVSGNTRGESRKILAGQLGINIETLRTRALRIRKELEKCILNCRKTQDAFVTSADFPSLSSEEPEK